MDILFEVICWILFLIFIFSFIFRKRKLLEIERDKKVLFKTRIVCFFGDFAYLKTSAELSVYSDFLVIKSFFKNIILNENEIIDVSINKFPNFGIKVKYSDGNSKDVLILYPYFFYRQKVFKILKSRIKNKE